MKDIMIGGPGSRRPEPVKWSVEPLLPEPSAVDFLAAIEDLTGESALRVAAWKTQMAGFEIDRRSTEELREADERQVFWIDVGDGPCQVTLSRPASSEERPAMLMGYRGESYLDAPMFFAGNPPPKPDPPSAVDELAALTDEDARLRVEAVKQERARWEHWETAPTLIDPDLTTRQCP